MQATQDLTYFSNVLIQTPVLVLDTDTFQIKEEERERERERENIET